MYTDILDLTQCRLCPRKCSADRNSGEAGVCGQTNEIKIARAALHFWEEPCISGKNGSGAVFFSGCSLKCIFCQNREISKESFGAEISVQRLAEIFLELQDKGAENINLVTPTHFIPQIIKALDMVGKREDKGQLKIPVVYNTSGYENVESLKALEGYVDIYLPDLKYADSALAKAFSGAEDYPEKADLAIAEMVRQVSAHCAAGHGGESGICSFDERGMMKSGVIVRHLVLPAHVRNSMEVLDLLYKRYNNNVFVSIMSQYTPPAKEVPEIEKYPELKRKVTRREYSRVVDHALELGMTNAYIQEGDTAKESFIPAFDLKGVF